MGRVYRKEAPVLYCPKCKTTVSQMELEDRIIKSKLVYDKVRGGHHDSHHEAGVPSGLRRHIR